MQPVVVVNAPAVSLTTTYSAGSALSQGLSIWARNAVFFFGVSVLASLPMGAASRLFLPIAIARRSLGGWALWMVGATVSGILGLIAKGFVTYSVLEQLRGRKPPFAEALAKGWSRAGLLFFVAFTTGILLFGAAVALVIPAIVLSVHWVLLSQVVVAEGDVDARARSAQLTAGHRWSIFGLMTLFWVVSFGLGTLARRLFGANLLTLTLPSALVLSVTAVVYSVIYYQLRSEKEGVDIEQLTAVFR